MTDEEVPFMPINHEHVKNSDEKIQIKKEETVVVINKISSSKSSLSSTNGSIPTVMCRICHCEEINEENLISPCYCTGTLRYVHQSCLQQWLKSNGMKTCELCKFEFIMQTKIRPFKNWQKLDMNRVERRKIMCSVAFHIIAITCVIWSLYVLIERTAEEIRHNALEWPFWTKLVVVAIGFTGGIVFMYIQCKMYLQLCLRWKQYNRVIIIQPITEDLLKKAKKKLQQQQQQQQQKSKTVNNNNNNNNNSQQKTQINDDNNNNNNFVININTTTTNTNDITTDINNNNNNNNNNNDDGLVTNTDNCVKIQMNEV